MIFKKDITLGYMYAYEPTHPLANKAGKVYEHIYVMVNHIGRKLHPNEVVHHVDRDRANNHISNLRLMTNFEHAFLHAIEDRSHGFETRQCKHCNKSYGVSKNSNQKFCSSVCVHAQTRKFDADAYELESLVWAMPTLQVAQLFDVSDVAIAKRCKLLCVDKPPRGYWAKRASKIQVLPFLM